MKPVKLFLNICIFFALVKVSVLEEGDFPNENDFILIGFQNYENDGSKVTFKALFMNLYKKNITKSFNLIADITYLKGNSYTTNNTDLKCTIDNKKQNDDYIYYSCKIPISNINNIKEISLYKESRIYREKIVPYNLKYYSYFNLKDCTYELYIFNLTQEIEEKPGQFILRGKIHKNLNDTNEFETGNNDYNHINGILKFQKKVNYLNVNYCQLI